ncbi:MAG: thioredoxin family protein [Planctomycetota bacterium]
MARTPSTMLPLGTAAPAFSLVCSICEQTFTNEQFAGRPMLVMFICNHCPFVKHVRAQLADLGRDYGDDVAIVAISSNDIEKYPDDSPAKMKAEAIDAGYTFPYLFDDDQSVAKAYRAACTPDFYVFDAAHKLAYRGQLDDSRPDNGKPVTGADLRAALDAVIAGKAPAEPQTPSLGCNIKWKPGNEPDYFG